jgi:hypothetical protein
MRTRVIGHRLFVDGVERPVYGDQQGKQYVQDKEEGRGYGVFIVPESESDDLPISL